MFYLSAMLNYSKVGSFFWGGGWVIHIIKHMTIKPCVSFIMCRGKREGHVSSK